MRFLRPDWQKTLLFTCLVALACGDDDGTADSGADQALDEGSRDEGVIDAGCACPSILGDGSSINLTPSPTNPCITEVRTRRTFFTSEWVAVGADALRLDLPPSGPFAGAEDPLTLEFRDVCGTSGLAGRGPEATTFLSLSESASAPAVSDEGSVAWLEGSSVRLFQRTACFSSCEGNTTRCVGECTRTLGEGDAPAISPTGQWVIWHTGTEFQLLRRRDRMMFIVAAPEGATPVLWDDEARVRLAFDDGTGGVWLAEWNADENPSMPRQVATLPCSADLRITSSHIGVRYDCGEGVVQGAIESDSFSAFDDLSCPGTESGPPVVTSFAVLAATSCPLDGVPDGTRIVMGRDEPLSWNLRRNASGLVGASEDLELIAARTDQGVELSTQRTMLELAFDESQLSNAGTFIAGVREGTLEVYDLGVR